MTDHVIDSSSTREILYVTKTSVIGEGGGGEKRAQEVTGRLAANGHRVTIVCGKTEPELPKWTESDGCRIRHITCAPEFILNLPKLGFYIPRYLFAFTSLPVLCYLLLKNEFDVIIENMTPYPTLTVLLAKFLALPIIAVQHEFHGRNAIEMYDPITGRIQLLVQNLLRVFTYDRIIVPTHHIQENLLAYGILSDRIDVVPNGINYHRFQLEGVDRSPTQLITVSRLGTRKGVDDVIRAFAAIKDQHPETTLDIVGSGPERENLETLATKLNVNKDITFHGYVTHGRKVELLHQAGIFVFASRQEGFGLVLLEAMAAGLPIVARELPVYHDFFEDGSNGYLIDDEQVESGIAARVGQLLSDPSMISEIRNVNERTAKRYRWDNTAEMTEAILCNVHKDN